MNPTETLQEVARQVSICQTCALCHSRKKAVPGEGPADARIMLVGEGPGFYENEQGRPFVGAAGKFLDELLEMGGLSRREVFITNVVKCRPPGNRDPLPEELLACGEYLERQIEAINPGIIVTLGRFSMARFLPTVRISEVHGKARWVNGRMVIAMYHPAAALHQPALKPVVMQDFGRIPELLKQYEAHLKPTDAATHFSMAQPGFSEPTRTAAAQPASLFDLMPQPEDASGPDKNEDDQEDQGPVQLSLF